MKLQINDIIIEVEETEKHYIYDGELDRAIFDNADKIGFIYGEIGVEEYGLELETFEIKDGKTILGFKDNIVEEIPTKTPVPVNERQEETNHGTAPEPETNLNLSSGNENESDTSNIADSTGK